MSPTTSIGRVLLTLTVCVISAVLLGAPGIVHSGNGMAYGPKRDVTLTIGRMGVSAGRALHLDWLWNQVQVALGHHDQPSVPPLLASQTEPQSVGPKAPKRALALQLGSRETHARRLAHARPRISRRARRQTGLRHPTRRSPLRLLVTGDSLVGFLGPALIDELAPHVPLQGWTDSHDGTGLTRPDFVDWSVVARQQVAAHHADVVVVMLGGNDFQNMVVGGNRVLIAGTGPWTQEYQRRAAVCMRIWAEGGASHVYWLSTPPARDPSWAFDDSRINLALQRAASTVPGAHYVDVLGPVTDHGRYADFVTDSHGQQLLVREPDGVHLNITGSNIVADEVFRLLVRQWHLH